MNERLLDILKIVGQYRCMDKQTIWQVLGGIIVAALIPVIFNGVPLIIAYVALVGGLTAMFWPHVKKWKGSKSKAGKDVHEKKKRKTSKRPVAIKAKGLERSTIKGNVVTGGDLLETESIKDSEIEDNIVNNPSPKRNNSPDVPLLHAIYFVAFGDWEIERENTNNFDAIHNAEARVIKSARHGEFPIWGNSEGKIEHLIPKEFWVENQLELMGSLKFNQPLSVRTVRNFEQHGAAFYDNLQTSRKAVEDLWAAL